MTCITKKSKKFKVVFYFLIGLILCSSSVTEVFGNTNRQPYYGYNVSSVKVFNLLEDYKQIKEYEGYVRLKEKQHLYIEEILETLFYFLENIELYSSIDIFEHWFDIYLEVLVNGNNIETYLFAGESMFLNESSYEVSFNVFFRIIEKLEEEHYEYYEIVEIRELTVNFDIGYKVSLKGESTKINYLQSYINYNFDKFNVRNVLKYNEVSVYLSADEDILLDFFMFLNDESSYIEIGSYIFTFYHMSFYNYKYSKTITVCENKGLFTLLEDYYIYIFFEVEFLEDIHEYEYYYEYKEEHKEANALIHEDYEKAHLLYYYEKNYENINYEKNYEEIKLFLYYHLKYLSSSLTSLPPPHNLDLRPPQKT